MTKNVLIITFRENAVSVQKEVELSKEATSKDSEGMLIELKWIILNSLSALWSFSVNLAKQILRALASCTICWSTVDGGGRSEPQDDDDNADLSDAESECDATSAKLRAKKQQVGT